MENRIIESVVKGILILTLCVAANLRSCVVYAQEFNKKRTITYMGFDLTFGTRSFTLNSDIAKIDGMKVLEEGGSLGVLFGNKFWQTKIRQGFFYSAARVPYTTDLVETELNINVNPLQLIKARFRSFEPYMTAGVTRNAVKLYGSYVKNDRAGDTEVGNSLDTQPYLGKIVAARGSVGAGLQYRVPYQHMFLRLFTEARYGYVLMHNTTSSWFKHTSVSNQVAVSAGVCFGYLK